MKVFIFMHLNSKFGGGEHSDMFIDGFLLEYSDLFTVRSADGFLLGEMLGFLKNGGGG